MDIDIDLPTDFDPLDYFSCKRASMVKDRVLKKHPVGTYFQNIPTDPVSGLSAIPYKEAEKLGFFKIDFLHLSILDYFNSKEEIRALIKTEPDWSLLENEAVVTKLFQIHKQFKIVSQIKPTSVIELADTIAIIRPSKRHLQFAYVKDKVAIRKELYRKEKGDEYAFKKSHAIAYALTIVLQLHLVKGRII